MATSVSWREVVLPNRTLLKELGAERTCQEKAMDCVMSIFRHCQARFFFNTQQKDCLYAHEVERERQWSSESRGLCVLVHGLRSHPVIWDKQISHLKKDPRVGLFVPMVPLMGLCSLEEAAQAILPTVVKYAKKNPGKPICVLGHSNGSRLAMWLEVQLRGVAPMTPVKVSTIAGVHFGSSRLELLEKFGVAKSLYPDVLRKELCFGSEVAKRLLSEVMAPLAEGVADRNYEFYATPTDVSIPDLGSSLPRLQKGEKIYILHGHSHDSIVGAVAREQIASCLEWISLQNT